MDEFKPKAPKKELVKDKSVAVLIAKRAHVIVQNEYKRVIDEGDILDDVPQIYIEGLKLEGVL